MPFSRVIRTGDGVTTQFVLDFATGYLEQADITCHVGSEVDGTGAPVYRNVTFLTETSVQISGAAPGNGVRVVFDRTVEKEDLLVHFSDGDTIDGDNLDLAFKQNLMAVQEALDGRLDEFSDDLDMGGFQINNLGAPSGNEDAANKAYVDGRLTDNGTLLVETEAARDAAVVARNTAAEYSTSAANSATAASTAGAAAANAALAGKVSKTGDTITGAAGGDSLLSFDGPAYNGIMLLSSGQYRYGMFVGADGQLSLEHVKANGDWNGQVLQVNGDTGALQVNKATLFGSNVEINGFLSAYAGANIGRDTAGSYASMQLRAGAGGLTVLQSTIDGVARWQQNSDGPTMSFNSFSAAGAYNGTPLVLDNAGVRDEIKINSTGDARLSLNGYRAYTLMYHNDKLSLQSGILENHEAFVTKYDADGNYVANPYLIGNDGVMKFGLRPTYGGVGLATLNEVGSGGTSGVASFKGRSGVVTPTVGDYDSTMITRGNSTVEQGLLNLANKTTFLTPASLGMIGDGVFDNTQKWIDLQNNAPAGGVTVIWTAGDFYFASPITQSATIFHQGIPCKSSLPSTPPPRGTRWKFAAGASLTIDKQNGGKFQGISFVKAAAGADLLKWKTATTAGEPGSAYIDFEDCQFYGPCTGSLVYMTNVLLITFKYCKFLNTYRGSSGSGSHCIWLDGSHFGVAGDVRTNDNVDNVEFSNCMISGTEVANSTDYSRIYGIRIDGKADSCKFFQTKVTWCFYGLWLTNSGPTTQVPNFTRFTDGGFENNYCNAIFAENGDICTFSNGYASLDNSLLSKNTFGTSDVIRVGPNYNGSIEFTAWNSKGGKASAYSIEGGRVSVNGGLAGNSGAQGAGYSFDILTSANSVNITGCDMRPMASGSDAQIAAARILKTTTCIIQGCFVGNRSGGKIIGAGSAQAGIVNNL